jgi:RNA polymerase sigma factor (sigma-70 family)
MEFSDSLHTTFRQMACKLSRNTWDQEDLVQEMWLHLLKLEKRGKLAGKTRSYLIRSCYFCAQHCLHCGKSMDSKRRWDVIIVSLDRPISFNTRAQNQERIAAIGSRYSSPADPVIETILIREIGSRLKAKQRETFNLLLDGYSISEIATIRGVDESTVRESIKSLRKIATEYVYPRN